MSGTVDLWGVSLPQSCVEALVQFLLTEKTGNVCWHVNRGDIQSLTVEEFVRVPKDQLKRK